MNEYYHININEEYLQKGAGFGAHHLSIATLQEKNKLSYTVPGFCFPLMLLQMQDQHNLMHETNLTEEMLKLGIWSLPNSTLQHIATFKESFLPRVHTHKENNGILIATSIAPTNIEEQQKAINTWHNQGFKVISVNYPEEITIVKKAFPHVHFFETQQDSFALLQKKRVYIDEILSVLKREGTSYAAVGIVNSDISLYEISTEQLLQACQKGMLISHRIDMPSRIVYTYGYDAFFFTLDMLDSHHSIGDYFLGEPWWDYIFTLYMLRQNKNKNKSIIQASPPICYHSEHPARWDLEKWLIGGAQFSTYLYTTLFKLPSLQARLKPNYFRDIQSKEKMQTIIKIYLYWIRHMHSFNCLNKDTFL